MGFITSLRYRFKHLFNEKPEKDVVIDKSKSDKANSPEDVPLKERISSSYDKLLLKDNLEDAHRIVHSETATKILTVMDKLLDIVKETGEVTLAELEKRLNVESELIEYWLSILEKEKYVELVYPLNIFSDIKIKYVNKRTEKKKTELPLNKELLDSYNVNSDHVVARINIWGTESKDIPIYQIIIPEIGEGTEAMMYDIIDKIAEKFNVDVEEFSQEEKKKELIKRFFNFTKSLIKNKLPKVDDEFIDILAGTMLHRMYGLGEIEILMSDNWIEEIAINGSKAPVSVYHKKFGWVKTTIWLRTEEEIYNFASRIGRNVGREINSLNPIMDAHLTTGDRVAATLFPISSMGNTITIRRFSRNPWTLITMIELNTMSVEIAALLWLAMQYELNIIVAGGTASGKTSALNSLVSLIPPKQRILSIEDTRELSLPKDLHWNWVPMTTRKANPEGKGEISMLDLMVASLRMRPDRIIVGEVRRKEQAEAMFETMHTGHSVYATLHADTVQVAIRRLLEPPISIPKMELGALHLLLIQYRDRHLGKRRTLEVAEIVSAEDSDINLNYLYRWRPRNDTFEKVNDSVRVVQELNLHTGMTQEEIFQNLKEKEMILKWLLKHKLNDVDKLGKIMKIYYSTPKAIVDAARDDLNPNRFFYDDIVR